MLVEMWAWRVHGLFLSAHLGIILRDGRVLPEQDEMRVSTLGIVLCHCLGVQRPGENLPRPRLCGQAAAAACHCPPAPCLHSANTNGCLCCLPTAIDLLYWRDIKQTGIVFGSFLLLLFSLTQFSVVSVVAYLALAALSATISFRIYKSVLQAVQKTDEGHPFK